MFGIGRKKVVQVFFYEVPSQQPFGTSQMPVEQLPDTFAVDTRMTLGDSDWRVVEARPVTKPEFRRSGSLELHLSRIENDRAPRGTPVTGGRVNECPRTEEGEPLRWSQLSVWGGRLPPSAGMADEGADLVVLQEDDWRQIEFVPAANGLHVAAMMERLDTLRREQDDGGLGFLKILMREELPTPIAALGIPPETIDKHLEGWSRLPLGIGDPDERPFLVEGGFSIHLGGDALIYGRVGALALEALCLSIQPSVAPKTWGEAVEQRVRNPGLAPILRDGGSDERGAHLVADLAEDFGLLIADWWSGVLVEPRRGEPIQQWFR